MKKLLSLICTITLMVTLVFGCTKPEKPETNETAPAGPNLCTDLSVYPIYDNLTDEEKIIWNNICTAIKNHSTERIHIGTYTTEYEHANAERRMGMMYRELVYSCPDYFWVNLYDYTAHTTQEGNNRHLELELHYILDITTAENYKEAYDAKVNEIVTAANQFPELFDRVLYAYDAVMANTQYDYELADSVDAAHLNLSAYGCLVEGKTICSGYALAFRSIMEKLGIECGVEFNSYQYLSGYVGHVWNYCKLDGEYYYFDPTWDDTGFDSEDYREFLPYSHLFFGLNREDLAKASYYMNEYSPVPECNGTKYNYFRYTGLSFPTYDYDAVQSVIREHQNEPVITLRFDSYAELERAKIDLVDHQRIFDILTKTENLSYMIPETDLHFLIFPG